MAEADRRRLLDRALALPLAKPDDFAGGRVPPRDADPDDLRIIADTGLRTKLVDVGLAEGLQSPKGPQKIASIVRIYPEFDAPGRKAASAARKPPSNGRAPASPQAGLPTVEQMERLVARVRSEERDVERELTLEADERVANLKRSLANLDGEELERAHAELGDALERRRSAQSQTRFEVFRRIESDTNFPERVYVRFLRRA